MTQRLTMTQKQILDLLREEGRSQAFIAKALGLSQSAVSNMYNGTRTMKLSEANELLSLLPDAAPTKTIPVIGMSGAGNWLEAIEHPSSEIAIPAGQTLDGEPQFAVEIVGDSMNLMLPEGSFALIDTTQKQLFVGRLYLLINADGEATVKRYRADPARFEPVSDNPDHAPFEVGVVDFRIIGRVIGALQRF